jgi:glycosyltransferase involved in cell wall biosynthesis
LKLSTITDPSREHSTNGAAEPSARKAVAIAHQAKREALPASRGSRRVLIVAPQPFYQDRGTPICVRQVIDALTQLEYQVDVLTYPVGRDLPGRTVRLIRSSNPFRISHVPVGFSFQKLLLDLTLVPHLRRLLASGQYDAVHAVEEAAFPAAFWGKRYGVPMIYDMHSSMAEQMNDLPPFRNGLARSLFGRMERWLLERSTRVISSAGLATRVRSVAPLAQVREWEFSSELPPPDPAEVDQLRVSLEIEPQQKVVLYSGTFERYQGLRLLLKAVPRVLEEEPEAVFVLVGVDGEHAAAQIEKIAHEIPGHRLRLVPRQPREKISTYFALAEVLVSPRVYGGNLPLKVFDYLAAGRPIVATDIPSHRSVLTEERAILVPPEEDAMAHAIIRVLRHPEIARQMADAGKEFAVQRLAWGRFVGSVARLYQSIDPARPEPAGP